VKRFVVNRTMNFTNGAVAVVPIGHFSDLDAARDFANDENASFGHWLKFIVRGDDGQDLAPVAACMSNMMKIIRIDHTVEAVDVMDPPSIVLSGSGPQN
jgi:hypothetical protein